MTSLFLPHILTFHALTPIYPDVISLIDLIEESHGQKGLRWMRVARELFSAEAGKREFATSVMRTGMSREFQDLKVKDVVKETVDLRNTVWDVQQEIEQLLNQNFDTSTLDLSTLFTILTSPSSDYTLKKSSLDQLSHCLFDLPNKPRSRALFFTQGLFQYLIDEVINAY